MATKLRSQKTGLSPGSPRLRALLEEGERLVEQGLVPLAIINDEEVYRAELDRIFGRCWVFVAHESEIPEPGDFVQRYIGEDPFIITRDDAGEINVLFDACIHHGAQVCRAEKGNASQFECPYHGWTYDSAGRLIGVPHRTRAYKGMPVESMRLHRAAQIDTYRGLIFACLDPETESLADYLGDFRWYLDIHLGLCEGGMTVVGEPNRWRIDADWKTAAENFCGDSYHTQTLHRSILDMGLVAKGGVGSGGMNDIHVTEISGHSTSLRRTGPGTDTLFAYPEPLKSTLTMPDLDGAQQEVARGSLLHTGNVFPNLSMIHLPAVDSPDKPSTTYFGLRQWQPRGPGKIEVVSWNLVPAPASEEYRREATKIAVASFSPSGNFEQDDAIVWASIARNADSILARRGTARLNFQMGLDGIGEAGLLEDWPGPGTAWDTNLEEGTQRTFFRHWFRAMAEE